MGQLVMNPTDCSPEGAKPDPLGQDVTRDTGDRAVECHDLSIALFGEGRLQEAEDVAA